MKTMQKLYKTKGLTIRDLQEAQKDLKQRMEMQQEQVLASAKRLVPFTKDSSVFGLSPKRLLPLSLITAPIKKGRVISVIEGVLIGYKLARSIRRFIRR